jgi:hypothetical protein
MFSNLRPHSDWSPDFYSKAITDLRTMCTGPEHVDPIVLTVKLAYNKFAKLTAVSPVCATKLPTIHFDQTWLRLANSGLEPWPRDVMWRGVHGVLPTRSVMNRLKITNIVTCPLCKVAGTVETYSHLFIQCNIVMRIWLLVLTLLRRSVANQSPLSEKEILFLNFDTATPTQHVVFASKLISEAYFSIWTKRNLAVFDNKNITHHDIIAMFLQRLRSRIKADFIRLDNASFRREWRHLANVQNTHLRISLPTI